jgi:uncharacterized protein YbaP (TraB family)
MKKFFAASVCALVLLGACATKPQSAPPEPALFVVKDADSTLYLYGTIHLRKTGAPWIGPTSQKAFDEASEFWTEIEMDQAKSMALQPIIARLGVDPKNPLSSRLTEKQTAELRKISEELELPFEALNVMRPWFASLTLTVTPMTKAGYDPEGGVDHQIGAAAQKARKTARWFETVEQQVMFLSGLSEPVQLQMLLDAMQTYQEGPAVLAGMEQAWETGDIDGLMTDMNAEMKAEYPELYAALLTRRNAAWVEVIKKELAGAGVDFVAVGAGHLAGDDSVVSMLRKQGLTVTRLTPIPPKTKAVSGGAAKAK